MPAMATIEKRKGTLVAEQAARTKRATTARAEIGQAKERIAAAEAYVENTAGENSKISKDVASLQALLENAETLATAAFDSQSWRSQGCSNHSMCFGSNAAARRQPSFLL